MFADSRWPGDAEEDDCTGTCFESVCTVIVRCLRLTSMDGIFSCLEVFTTPKRGAHMRRGMETAVVALQNSRASERERASERDS